MVILVTIETVIYFGSKYKTVWNIGNFSNSRNIDHLATLTQVWHRGLGGARTGSNVTTGNCSTIYADYVMNCGLLELIECKCRERLWAVLHEGPSLILNSLFDFWARETGPQRSASCEQVIFYVYSVLTGDKIIYCMAVHTLQSKTFFYSKYWGYPQGFPATSRISCEYIFWSCGKKTACRKYQSLLEAKW